MNDKIQKHLDLLLTGRELQLAVEGRSTNLRVFLGKDNNDDDLYSKVYIRLDCCNAYSVPLTRDKVLWLESEGKPINNIMNTLTLYTFPASIIHLEAILNIIRDLKPRKIRPW